MDKRVVANKLVADFGKTLTVPNLELDAQTNSCVLVFDGELLLNIEYDAAVERLVFSIYLEELPKEGAEPLLRELMGANLYWHRTRGATLCLEEGTNGVILVYSRSVNELDGPGFEALVENLVGQAEKWRRRIKESAPAVAPSAAPVLGDTGFRPIFG
ncbi:type III secretion system chaperone [Propionivibrio soli]|uniref:type III secretion system chaperone n=1 Tax=Propionivibrio soli TaxID=2976531 RepID=UPI0021E9284B|nr:type III secretion system chaperone [Propionivibrio soli]